MKNIILLAPPAAGKGTQSKLICSEYGYSHISTGALIRNEISKGNKELLEIVESGSLVRDDIIIELLKQALNNVKGGVVLDGFPRNIAQAIEYDKLLSSLNKKVDHVIYLDLPKEIAKKRITGRVSCPNCGQVYNTLIEGGNSKVEGICDVCQSQLIKRVDDSDEIFENRYATYLKETKPLIEYYDVKGLLRVVDSSKPAEYIFKKIEEIIND